MPSHQNLQVSFHLLAHALVDTNIWQLSENLASGLKEKIICSNLQNNGINGTISDTAQKSVCDTCLVSTLHDLSLTMVHCGTWTKSMQVYSPQRLKPLFGQWSQCAYDSNIC